MMPSKQKKKIRTKKDIDKRYIRSSERSPYWDDFANKRQRNTELAELPEANPDSLREEEGIFQNSQPSTPHFLLGEAVEHLQGRQKEVYLLTMREGRSLAEVAELLGMAKGTAQTYLKRAIKFIKGYCAEAITKGRI
jgi:RNA polymerase sigma factor (sigma-70 family)